MAFSLREAYDIVIIGGGVTGLAAAWELQASAPGYAVAVLESSGRWGGKILTEQLSLPDGGQALVDAGPESFVTRKPEVWNLAREIGLRDQIKATTDETRHIYVLDQGVPKVVPLSPPAFIKSRLLSTRGKLRLLAEPFAAPRRDFGDETLAEFANRRLGHEAQVKMIGPVLAGIYNANPEQQSILVASPVMREMERESGSLFVAALGRMLKARQQARDPARPPRFITFEGGAQTLVDSLTRRLDADLRLNSRVKRLAWAGDGYAVVLADGSAIRARAVLVATLANTAATLLAPVAPWAAAGLARIRHNSIGTLTLAYHPGEARTPFPINGLMIPRRERRAIDAVTWPSAKMPERAPGGHTLVRVFFGAGQPALVGLDDGDLIQTAGEELKALVGLDAAPVGYSVARWPDGFPQADVGHLDHVAAIERRLPPGIVLAGSSYRGVAVPDCIRQGRAAAAQIATYLARENEVLCMV